MNARECRRCGHAAAAHPPYIPGLYRPGPCETCRCWQWLPERPLVPLLRRLLGWPRPRHACGPSVVPPGVPPQRSAPPLPGPEAYNGETCFDLHLLPSRARPYVPGPRPEDEG